MGNDMDEEAITCSLDPQDYQRRLEAIRELGEAALLDVETRRDRVMLRFRDSDEVRDRLASIVQAEAACCSFLELTVGSDAQGLTLEISAPSDAMPVVQDLTASFQGAVTR
jgi:hypothetical protein